MTGSAKADAVALMESAWNELDSRFAALGRQDLEHPVFTGEGSDWAARDDLRAALAQLPSDLLIVDDAETDGIRRYIWQPAVNHLRQHPPHITAALAKKGATT